MLFIDPLHNQHVNVCVRYYKQYNIKDYTLRTSLLVIVTALDGCWDQQWRIFGNWGYEEIQAPGKYGCLLDKRENERIYPSCCVVSRFRSLPSTYSLIP